MLRSELALLAGIEGLYQSGMEPPYTSGQIEVYMDKEGLPWIGIVNLPSLAFLADKGYIRFKVLGNRTVWVWPVEEG